jgi:hypothetical protein
MSDAPDLTRLAEHVGRVDATTRTLRGELSLLAKRYAAVQEQVTDQGTTLLSLDGIAAKVADLDARVPPADDDGEPAGKVYKPVPAPRWHKLTAAERAEVTKRLDIWVRQVFQPVYGRLAEGLAGCWPEHVFCLDCLDVMAELWGVLYGRTTRTAGIVQAQAEFTTRVMPAFAELLRNETSSCAHRRRAQMPQRPGGASHA